MQLGLVRRLAVALSVVVVLMVSGCGQKGPLYRNAPVPAIFRYTNGRERTVNTQAIEAGALRVSGVNRQWVLRIGEEVVCIEATPPAGVGS